MSAGLALAWALVAMLVAHGLRIASAVVASRRGRPASPCPAARVAIVRPFRGLDEGALAKNLSLVHQAPATEVLFVSESAADPGTGAARTACEAAPGRARWLASAGQVDALSGKAANMIVGYEATTAPFVAFCDSDLALAPDDVARCLALFDAPDVGAVFAPCLFDAGDAPGRLAMLLVTVDASVLVAAADRVGRLPFLQGGLMVIRRSALEAAGGIAQIADAVADDLRLGRLLRDAGFRLRATDRPLIHRSPPEGVRAWAARYHRWMVCQRSEAPAGFWLMWLCNPVVAPGVAALAGGTAAVGLFVASLAIELGYTAVVERTALRPRGVRLGAWVLARPLADLLHFAFCTGALLYPRVHWRGRTYRLGLRGRIVGPRPARVPAGRREPLADRSAAPTEAPGPSPISG